VGFCPYKAAAREPEVAVDAGILGFFALVGIRSQGENKQAAQKKGADKSAITF
jgi:hypothetical protein